MLTRSVETGPEAATFAIRDGALAYAPFDATKTPDGKIYDSSNNILSPIDEFNAPGRRGAVREARGDVPGREHSGHRGPHAIWFVFAA